MQQPIFTWGKISNGVKALKEVESVRSLQLTDTENQLNAELKSRLSAIYYMDDIISLLNEQKSYADRLVELAHAAQEQGIMLAQEVKETEINAANESTLINAMAKLDRNAEDIADIRERMPNKKPVTKLTISKSSTKKKES